MEYHGFDCNTESNISDNVDDVDSFLINLFGNTYVGYAFYVQTTKASATDFNFKHAKANSVDTFNMDGQSKTN